MRDERPPQFLLWEVVRIARATGRELNAHHDPFDARSLVDLEAVVVGAVPTDAGDAWLVHGWIDSLGKFASFPEEALESTGLEDDRSDPDHHRRGPLDVTRRWEDDVLVDLRTGSLDNADVEAVALEAAAALARVEGVTDVDWEIVPGDGDRWITLWARSDGDALQTFGRIVALSPRSWEHRGDEHPLILSYWKRSRGSEFLAPAVRRASVTYRRMTSPRRRSRSEIWLPDR